MKNKHISILVLTLLATSLFAGTGTLLHDQTDDNKVKNVIILIGDGMGFEHLKLGSFVEYGNDSGLFMQQDEFYKGKATTYSADDAVTDSAASATAIATGYKTDDGMVGQLPNGTNIETILEYAQTQDKKTGLVSSAYFYHATPAAFTAHQDSRYEYEAIITDMMNSGTDLILGGGFHRDYLPDNVGFDNLLTNNNYTYINTTQELTSIDQNRTVGLFGDGHLPYEADIDVDTDVQLHQLTEAALTNLNNENGLFLMVEGARIDHAGHESNATRNALEVIEFDKTVKLVYDWVQNNPDTLVIITGDHETGGLVIDSTSFLDENLPNEEPTEAGAQFRRIERARQVNTSYTAQGSYHTAQDVPVMAFGEESDRLFPDTQYDNTGMYYIMKSGFDGTEISFPTTPTSTPVSDTTTTSPEQSSSPPTSTGDKVPISFIFILSLGIIPILQRLNRQD